MFASLVSHLVVVFVHFYRSAVEQSDASSLHLLTQTAKRIFNYPLQFAYPLRGALRGVSFDGFRRLPCIPETFLASQRDGFRLKILIWIDDLMRWGVPEPIFCRKFYSFGFKIFIRIYYLGHRTGITKPLARRQLGGFRFKILIRIDNLGGRSVPEPLLGR